MQLDAFTTSSLSLFSISDRIIPIFSTATSVAVMVSPVASFSRLLHFRCFLSCIRIKSFAVVIYRTRSDTYTKQPAEFSSTLLISGDLDSGGNDKGKGSESDEEDDESDESDEDDESDESDEGNDGEESDNLLFFASLCPLSCTGCVSRHMVLYPLFRSSL